MNATARQPEGSAYVFALERLVTYYPKKEYWAELIAGVQRKPGFSRPLLARHLPPDAGHRRHAQRQRLHGDDAARAAGRLRRRGQGGRSTRASRPACWAPAPRPSARSACATWPSGRLDEDARRGAGAGEPRRSRRRTARRWWTVGFNQALSGPGRQGRALIEQGHRQGRPEAGGGRQAAPRPGQLMAGDEGQGAGHACKTVPGADGTADLARLWVLYARRKRLRTRLPRGRPSLAAEAACRRSQARPRRYFGARRIAPSRRITSPLSISLVTIWCTSLA